MEKVRAGYEKAQEAVTKQEATIARHEKNLSKLLQGLMAKGVNVEDLKAAKWEDSNESHYWDICKAENLQADLIRARKKLEDRVRIAQSWFEKLGTHEKWKAVFAELPPIILEFAAGYKAQCIDWLLEGAQEYGKKMKELETIEDRSERARRMKGVRQAFGGTIIRVYEQYTESARRAEAEKIAEQNRVDLLRTLAHRVAEKVGCITDAGGLGIGMNGEINGRVIGDKGAATIKTILAGGWNIQCLHFRVLIQN
jgi:hypothetical protein